MVGCGLNEGRGWGQGGVVWPGNWNPCWISDSCDKKQNYRAWREGGSGGRPADQLVAGMRQVGVLDGGEISSAGLWECQ